MTRHLFKLIWHRKRTNLLLIAELFFSLLVVFAVAAIGVYVGENWRKPIGFSPDDLWVVQVDTKGLGTPAEQIAQMDRVTAALRDMPEVVSVAGCRMPPYFIGAAIRDDEFHGRRVEYGVNEVTDSFKDVLGLEVIEGRWFSREDDGASYLPVVINADMAQSLFPGESAVGQRLSPDQGQDGKPIARPQRVVGVVAAYREDGETDAQQFQALLRDGQSAGLGPHDAAAAAPAPATAGDSRQAAPDAGAEPEQGPLGNLIVRVRPGTTAAFEEMALGRIQPVARDWSFDLKPMSERRASLIRFFMAPVVAVALLAAFLLLMVALGLTGVLWQNVTQRTRELGLRRAKGASKAAVQRQILGEILVMTTFAVLLAGVLVAQVPLLSPLYWIGPHVYVVGFIIATAAMYALTAACGWYPSRLATTVEPAEALRYE